MRIYGVSDYTAPGTFKGSREVFKRVEIPSVFEPCDPAAKNHCELKSTTLARDIGIKRQSGTSINDLRSVFEKCQLRASDKERKKQLAVLEQQKQQQTPKKDELSKSERDTREKEHQNEKRKRRIHEFIQSTDPSPAKRSKATVYNTIIDYALTDTVEPKRVVMSPSESYRILTQWINNRTKNYASYTSPLSDLSVSSFSSGLVLCAIAHSYSPFSTPFFSIVNKPVEARFVHAWTMFKSLTGEEPVYCLTDVLGRGLDRKCLITMLIRLREQLEFRKKL